MRLPPVRRPGLTLMEVLVALAIFLVSLVALTHLVTNSTRLSAEASHRAQAAQLARSKMNEFASGALPMQGVSDTAFEDETGFNWSAEVGGGSVPGLYNVTVTVTFRPDDPYPIVVSMSRMMLDPAVCGSTQDVPAAPSTDATEDSSSSSGSTASGSGSTSSGSSGSSGSSTPSGSSGSSGSRSTPSMGSSGSSGSMGGSSGSGSSSSGSKGTSPSGSSGTGNTGTGSSGGKGK